MTRTVFYSPRASSQLTDLCEWIAEQSGFPDRADGYVTAIFAYCDSLADFPLVGMARDDLRPGLRTIGFRRHVASRSVDTTAPAPFRGMCRLAR